VLCHTTSDVLVQAKPVDAEIVVWADPLLVRVVFAWGVTDGVICAAGSHLAERLIADGPYCDRVRDASGSIA
jgi:hypothetical protein